MMADAAYGLWPLVAVNIVLFVVFAMSFFQPRTKRDWRAMIAFLVPFLDVGIAQSPMLRAEPADWARFLPGYGADRVLLDGGLTAHFDEAPALLLGLGWLLVLGVLAARLFRRSTT
ncbi:hypothetical protein ACIRG5_25230 [Lentzea sp. NPDC102401]|uniref:hypothetical protein n=1 Tax=Lentzea sp. NPDC102401 TaxID=3364128 RepID=UPI00380FB34C